MKNLLLFLALSLFIFSSCEKEEMTPDVETLVNSEKAAGLCNYNDSGSAVRLFEFCTSELHVQGELRYANANGIHFIKAKAKCHKQGSPNSMVKIREMIVSVEGDMHIGCGLPIDISVPSVYNSNLVLGQVVTEANCVNCSSTTVRIDYTKDITYLEGDVLRGKFKFELDNCGEQHTEFFEVEL